MSLQAYLKMIVTALLLVGMGAVLLLSTPSRTLMVSEWWYAILFAALTAMSLPLSVLLSRTEMSITHAVGAVAFLSFEREMLPLMVWAIFAGSVLGSLLVLVRQGIPLAEMFTRQRVQNIVASTVRVTLSFYLSAQFYILLQGQLPLRAGSNAFLPPLVLYGAVLIGLYTALYALELYIAGRDVVGLVRADGGAIVLLLFLPVAYAILVAIIHEALPLELFLLGVMGLALSLVVTFSYSRNQSQLRQQLDEMRALSNLSQELQASTDPTALVRALEAYLPNILHADNLIIATVDIATDEVTYPLVMRQRERLYGDEVPFPEDRRLIASVLQSGKPLRLDHHDKHRDQSWLGVPMQARSRSIGALVMTSAHQHAFDGSEMRLLRIITPTLATALENTQLYQQQQERVARLNTLNTISVLLSSTLSPENVLDTITSSAAMLSEANAVTVYLLDNDSEHLALQRSAGLSEAFLADPPELLLQQPTQYDIETATAIVEYQPLIVENITEDKRTRGRRSQYTAEGVQAFIELPLVTGERLLGEVVLYYQMPKRFDREFVEFLRTFASEAVQAVKNAQLYARTDEALEQRLFQLSILAAVGQQTNASIDLQTISDIVLDFALGYVQMQRGLIALHERENGQLQVMAQRGYGQGVALALFQQGILQKALQTGQYFNIEDVQGFSNAVRLAPTTASQMIVPILRDRDVLGVVVLEDDTPNALSKEDARFIVQLFNQAAIAIDNRNLFQTVMQARDRMQVILDAMTEAIVLINTRGEIVMANPAVRLIELQPDALIGQRLDQLVIANAEFVRCMGFASAAEVKKLLTSFEQDDDWRFAPENFTIHANNQTRYIERQIIPVRGESEHTIGMLLVFYDQSKQIELDRTREDFTRMIVHDLRSPLTAVTTSLRLVARLVPSDIEQHDNIEQITASSNQVIRKMLQRVDSLLDVAKMESGEITLDMTDFDLSERVQHVFEELAPLAADQKVTLTYDPHAALPNVHADSDKIERVIQNLVDNALKHTAKGTQVVVQALDGDSDVTVKVIDRGPGIPAAYRERLFERFVQISGQEGARRGVGLGLTFCRLVVEAHGGRIWIEDNPAGGSVFAFTLQKAPAAEGTS